MYDDDVTPSVGKTESAAESTFRGTRQLTLNLVVVGVGLAP